VSSGELELVSLAAAAPLGASITYVSPLPGMVTGVEPARSVEAVALPTAGEAAGPTMLIVPGGLGWQTIVELPDFVAWLRVAAEGAKGVVSISTGSLLLAATGLLDGLGATGHWLAHQDLADLGAEAQTGRSVSAHNGRWVTASGTQAASVAASELAQRILWGRSLEC